MKQTDNSYFETRYAYVQAAAGDYYDKKAKQLQAALNEFGVASPQSLLDLGCGCGDLSNAYGRLFSVPCAGIDQDKAMVGKANEAKIGQFHVSNVLEPVSSLKGQFDTVVSFEVFEHLTHDQHGQALAMVKYYAKDNGVGAIMVPNVAHPLVGNFLAWSDYTHRTCFTPESLVQMLRSHGITNVRVLPWYIGSRPSLLWFRKKMGTLLGSVHKLVTGLVTSVPRVADPSLFDTVPFSSHLIAVFKINDR